MTERRCQGCGTFYDKKEPVCTFCGEPPYKFNKFLRTAQLNHQLNVQAENARVNH